jgi:arylsulfatase A-like enzyme
VSEGGLDMNNIALVVLDTVRKDFFDEYFDWIDGLQFHSAYSTANWTGPAHASMFTGEYGSAVGVSSKSRKLDCDRQVLTEKLRQAGYNTRGWSANPNVSSKMDFDRGFGEFKGLNSIRVGGKDILDFDKIRREYDYSSEYRLYLRILYEAITSDCSTIGTLQTGMDSLLDYDLTPTVDDGAATVLRLLEETQFGDREFLFINLMEAHTPYHPPEPYRKLSSPVEMPFGEAYLGVEDPERVKLGYESAIEYLSDMYNKMYSELRKDFDYVITLSDHGELLGEHHGMWNHVSGIYPELTHVPLVISGDDLSGHRDTTVSLLDIYSTILEMADMDDRSSSQRHLLSPSLESETYVAEYRGPFDTSIRKAKEKDLNLEKYDRDLFALIEEDYYGYEDYDGWKEQGETSRDSPRDDLHALVKKYGMDGLKRDQQSDMSSQVEARLERLGYM